jgi:lipoate synthase
VPPGPYTGRDPDVKKPAWLRQRAPQGEKYAMLRESLGELKLNTVCVEAQCPNIGEVGVGQNQTRVAKGGIKIRCIIGCV